MRRALVAEPRPASVPGLEFLKASFYVDQPLLEALAHFHRGMEVYLAQPQNNTAAQAQFHKALNGANKSHDLALKAFPHPIDPVGGEVGAIRDYSAQLIQSTEAMLR